jgi:YVTN family beta-propeller protein
MRGLPRAAGPAALALLLAGCSPDAGGPAVAATSPIATATESATATATPTRSPNPTPVATSAPTAEPLPPAAFGPKDQLLPGLLRWDTGSQPKQVAFTPDGREVWTTLLDGSGVQIYAAATGERLEQVELGRHGAVEVIFTRDGRTAYASQMESGSVFEIDTATRAVRRQIAGKGEWSKVMTLSPDERTLYLANWISNDVSEIDLAAGKVRRLIPTVKTPRGLYVTPDGAKLYVAGYESGEIQVVDLATGKGRVLLRTGGAMRHLVGDPVAMRLYADDMATSTIHVVDLRTEELTRLAKVDANPNTIDLSPDGRLLFVSCRGRNGPDYERPGPEWGSVVVVDTATGRLLDAIVGGDQTTGLDVSADGTRLAYSDFLGNRISIHGIPPYDALDAGGGGRVAEHKAELAKHAS